MPSASDLQLPIRSSLPSDMNRHESAFSSLHNNYTDLFRVHRISHPTSAPSTIASHVLTSRKWAAPLADILSARDPASMYTATVEVDMPGMVSDEIDNPLDNVEVCVTGSAYRLVWTGVANVRASGDCASV